MKQLSLLCVLALFLGGCASRVVGLQKDESFTYNTLKQAPLVLGGVVDSINEQSAVRNMNSLNQLKTSITEEAEGIRVSRAGFLKSKIGKKAYRRILSEYRDEGGFSEGTMQFLSKKLKGRRYVVFSRLQRDEIFKRRDDRQTKDDAGNVLPTKKITMISGRYVDAGVDVLDLHLKKIVWSGVLKKQRTNADNHTFTPPKEEKEDNRGLGGLINLVKAFKGDEKPRKAINYKEPDYKFPKAPSTQYVLNSIFTGFAENLPEED